MNILSGRALAKELGVTPRTILNYGNRGMPFIKIGEYRKYVLEQVQEWLKNGGEVIK